MYICDISYYNNFYVFIYIAKEILMPIVMGYAQIYLSLFQ